MLDQLVETFRQPIGWTASLTLAIILILDLRAIRQNRMMRRQATWKHARLTHDPHATSRRHGHHPRHAAHGPHTPLHAA
ncbi:hypothetical protein [Pseudoscardovia suis]|uniref:Uncharacterized protein n=1 Tax=Pseudoscardovia suis TaxID=987063 RepID=A0A261EPU5_9BIFI|nr:hypothetical protein [Pseudoscardovia suis]OZG48878.1 hypothetical protein PSSU_1702 [Pseudoscardovia suis]PJJ63934.1 hypothetical protein CLV65_1557 [Pseudoscardovia suis]